jgi:hypothetical protein
MVLGIPTIELPVPSLPELGTLSNLAYIIRLSSESDLGKGESRAAGRTLLIRGKTDRAEPRPRADMGFHAYKCFSSSGSDVMRGDSACR